MLLVLLALLAGSCSVLLASQVWLQADRLGDPECWTAGGSLTWWTSAGLTSSQTHWPTRRSAQFTSLHQTSTYIPDHFPSQTEKVLFVRMWSDPQSSFLQCDNVQYSNVKVPPAVTGCRSAASCRLLGDWGGDDSLRWLTATHRLKTAASHVVTGFKLDFLTSAKRWLSCSETDQ